MALLCRLEYDVVGVGGEDGRTADGILLLLQHHGLNIFGDGILLSFAWRWWGKRRIFASGRRFTFCMAWHGKRILPFWGHCFGTDYTLD